MIKPWIAQLIVWSFRFGLPMTAVAVFLSGWFGRGRVIVAVLLSAVLLAGSMTTSFSFAALFGVTTLAIYTWAKLLKKVGFRRVIIIVPLLLAIPILTVFSVAYVTLNLRDDVLLPVYEKRLDAQLVCRSYRVARLSDGSAQLQLFRYNPNSWKDDLVESDPQSVGAGCQECILAQDGSVMMKAGCEHPTVQTFITPSR